MKYYYQHPDEIHVEEGSKEEAEKMITKILSKEFNAAVVDRTGNINTFVENLYPLPAPADSPIDFNQLMDERAEEIVEYAADRGKEIRMEWNGLMTQTAALLSIIRYITDKENMPKLTVFIVGKADTKRPDFYKKWIEDIDFVNVVHVTKLSNRLNMGKPGNYITVNDAGGQNLFAVGYMTFADHKTPFVDVCEPEFYEIIKPILDEMPQDWNNEDPLTTTYTSSAMHWLNFVLKWQWVAVKRYIKTPDNITFDDIKCFYHTDKFQQWFYQVPPLAKHVDLQNKKSHWHCRQYIWQFHDDESMQQCQYVTGRSYRNMESQQQETNPILHRGRYCIAIDENWGKHWRDRGNIQFEVVEDDESLAS